MIDIHSHILPGVDDGPRSWGDALALCRLMAQDGITTAVATPHLIDGVYDNVRSRVEPLVQQLRGHLQTAGIALEVRSGAEIDFSSYRLTNASHDLPALDNSRGILLEMPVAVIPPAISETIFVLRSRGLIPVIAHPERNERLQEDPATAAVWVEAGALLQLDAESLLGLWGRRTKRCAEDLLLRQLVHALASDAHSVDKRPPRLAQALTRAIELVGPEAGRLVADSPRMILAGEIPPTPLYTISVRPNTSLGRGFLGRFFSNT